MNRKIFCCLAFVFGILLMVSTNLQNAEALPPSPIETIEKHRDYVNSVISMQEKPSLKEQQTNNIPPHSIMCNNDFVLLLKWTNNESACVTSQTAKELVLRNWGVYSSSVNVVGFDDSDPYDYFGTKGGKSYISFEYDDDKFNKSYFVIKFRENLSENLNELGFSGNHWAYLSIDKESEGYFTLGVGTGIREDLMQSSLEKIDGVSNIGNYFQQV